MQRFVQEFRQKIDIFNGIESSPQSQSQSQAVDPPPGCHNDDVIKPVKLSDIGMTTATSNEMTQNVLNQLIKCNDENYQRGMMAEEREITDMEHIRQIENWDCGLACMQMILQWLKHNNNNPTSEDVVHRIHNTTNATKDNDELIIDDDPLNGANTCNNKHQSESDEKAWMVQFLGTKSIWTIDLVFLLEHVLSGGATVSDNNNNNQTDVVEEVCENEQCPPRLNSIHPFTPPLASPSTSSTSYLFTSSKFGVDESYNKLGYYQDKFTADERRVNSLFEKAHLEKLPLLQTSHLTMEVLVDLVGRKNVVAIVLLDNRILTNSNATAPIANTTTASYSGHYVILCGISRGKNDIEYALFKSSPPQHENDNDDDNDRPKYVMVLKNPGTCRKTELVTPEIFEKAWRAKGTDEDVIFIAKHDDNF